MIDQVTLDRIARLHPKLRDEAKAIYFEINNNLKGKAICRFAYTLRTDAEQDALYAIGRTKPGKVVTNARGGESLHNYGLAIDIVLLVDKNGDGTFETASWQTNVDFDGDGVADWMEVVKIFKLHGFEWVGIGNLQICLTSKKHLVTQLNNFKANLSLVGTLQYEWKNNKKRFTCNRSLGKIS
mgnify:CR=1 FL=1